MMMISSPWRAPPLPPRRSKSDSDTRRVISRSSYSLRFVSTRNSKTPASSDANVEWSAARADVDALPLAHERVVLPGPVRRRVLVALQREAAARVHDRAVLVRDLARERAVIFEGALEPHGDPARRLVDPLAGDELEVAGLARQVAVDVERAADGLVRVLALEALLEVLLHETEQPLAPARAGLGGFRRGDWGLVVDEGAGRAGQRGAELRTRVSEEEGEERDDGAHGVLRGVLSRCAMEVCYRGVLSSTNIAS